MLAGYRRVGRRETTTTTGQCLECTTLRNQYFERTAPVDQCKRTTLKNQYFEGTAPVDQCKRTTLKNQYFERTVVMCFEYLYNFRRSKLLKDISYHLLCAINTCTTLRKQYFERTTAIFFELLPNFERSKL